MEDLEKLFKTAINEHGVEQVAKALQDINSKESDNILTIIVNKGTHPMREAHTRGNVFYASEGIIDYSTDASIINEFETILKRVTSKLYEKPWDKIYLVPFGPSTLSMQIKLLVYRVLHMETIDVLHVKDNSYLDIEIKLKKIITKSFE